jgi:hypothetical protein
MYLRNIGNTAHINVNNDQPYSRHPETEVDSKSET